MLTVIAQLALASAALAAPLPQEVVALDVPPQRHGNAAPIIMIDAGKEDGLIVEASGESTLADLVDAYTKLEGIRILSNEQLRQVLETTPLHLYGAPRTLTQSELSPFVEGVLRSSGFLLVSTGGESTYALANDRMLNYSALSWAVVDRNSLDEMRRHPALLMQTSITLQHVDVRQLSTSLRSLLQNPWQSLVAFGNSDSLILRGTGLELARTIHLFDGIEGLPRAAPPAAVKVSEAPAQPVAAPATATESGPRPKLVTRIFEIQGDTRRIANTAEDLTRVRHKEQYTGRLWKVDATTSMSWPTPRFLEDPNTSRVLVIAAAEDFPAIEADLKWAAMLHKPKE